MTGKRISGKAGSGEERAWSVSCGNALQARFVLYDVIKVKIFVYFNAIISSKYAEKYTNLFRIEADSFFRFSIVQGRKDSAESSIELFRSYTVEK